MGGAFVRRPPRIASHVQNCLEYPGHLGETGAKGASMHYTRLSFVVATVPRERASTARPPARKGNAP